MRVAREALINEISASTARTQPTMSSSMGDIFAGMGDDHDKDDDLSHALSIEEGADL